MNDTTTCTRVARALGSACDAGTDRETVLITLSILAGAVVLVSVLVGIATFGESRGWW